MTVLCVAQGLAHSKVVLSFPPVSESRFGGLWFLSGQGKHKQPKDKHEGQQEADHEAAPTAPYPLAVEPQLASD